MSALIEFCRADAVLLISMFPFLARVSLGRPGLTGAPVRSKEHGRDRKGLAGDLADVAHDAAARAAAQATEDVS